MNSRICESGAAGYRGRPARREVNLARGPGMHLRRGPNGAGTTTFLRVLAGVLPPRRGQVRVAGRDPHREPAAKQALALGATARGFRPESVLGTQPLPEEYVRRRLRRTSGFIGAPMATCTPHPRWPACWQSLGHLPLSAPWMGARAWRCGWRRKISRTQSGRSSICPAARRSGGSARLVRVRAPQHGHPALKAQALIEPDPVRITTQVDHV